MFGFMQSHQINGHDHFKVQPFRKLTGHWDERCDCSKIRFVFEYGIKSGTTPIILAGHLIMEPLRQCGRAATKSTNG
jgi:hypothetical protein